MDLTNLHPNDIRLFKTVVDAMRHVAKNYELPLHSVIPFPMPEYRTSPLGDCQPSTGTVRLVLRGMQDGKWDEEARREEDVWKTAAHELAHLRYPNHGVQFQEFELEMMEAMNNRKINYQQKIIDKLVKLQKSRESETKIGNSEAAESFASMINKMLIENELHPSDIDYARTTDNDPVIEVPVNFSMYHIDPKKKRIAWQETLAGVVAQAHLCTFLISPNSNRIVFVGTKSHATVAEYVYGTLVPLVDKMSFAEALAYWKETGSGRYANNPARGFRAAWTQSFINRINERFREARQAAVREVSQDVNVQSQALIRLNGAVIKTQKYIDDKFGVKRRYANALNSGRAFHEEGRARGREAANRITMGRRAIESRSVKGYIEE